MDEAQQHDEDVGRFLYAIHNASMRRWPYRHFVATEVLDPALVEELRALDLSCLMDRLKDRRGTDINANRYSLSLIPGPTVDLPPPVIRLGQLFEAAPVAHALFAVFRDVIEQRMRLVEGGGRLRRSLDLIEDRTGYSLPPHTDQQTKLVTLILYFDDAPVGTSIYTPRQGFNINGAPTSAHYARRAFTRVATAPHRAGNALCFAPSQGSFHGVEPVEPGARRYLAQFHLIAADPKDLIT